MKINREKYELARARKCISFNDLVESGIPKGSLCRVIGGADARPETIGKIAKALDVDPTELID